MHDPRREGARWLAQAEVDLSAARHLAERFPALACFHAQQSAEKALKAILYAAGERPVLGHSLSELGQRVVQHYADFAEIRASVAKLDRYYIPTRYPNGLPEGGDPASSFDVEDARAAIATAERALGLARGFLRPPGSEHTPDQTESPA